MRWTFPIGAACAAFAVASRAFAEPNEASQLESQADAALAAHYYYKAIELYRRADIAEHSPLHMLGLARAEAGAGKLVSAQRHYVYFMSEVDERPAEPSAAKTREEAKAESNAVAQRLGTIVIVVAGPAHPIVTLDDTPLGETAVGQTRAVDPGPHVVRVTAVGYRAAEARISIVEGAVASVALTLAPTQADPEPVAPRAPEPAPPAPTESSTSLQKTAAYAALGLGAAGLLTGIVASIMATNKVAELRGTCAPNCPPSEVDSARTTKTIAGVGWIAGGLFAAGGLTLLLTAPKDGAPREPGAHVTAYIGPGTVGAAGTF